MIFKDHKYSIHFLLPWEWVGKYSPKGQYFLIHSLGQISGAHPRVENINNASAIHIGKMKTFAGRQNSNTLVVQIKYTVFTVSKFAFKYSVLFFERPLSLVL